MPERKLARGKMEIMKHMRGNVLSDRWLSETQVCLKLVLPFLEGTTKWGQSIINSLKNVLLCRFEVDVRIAETAERIAPFQPSLIVSYLKICCERFLEVKLQTVVFPEGRAPSQLGWEATDSIPIKGLIDASIQPILLHRFNVQTWYKILWIPDLFPPLLHDQMMQFMFLFSNGQLILILRLYDIPQIFLLLLQLQPQQLLPPLVVLFKVAQLLLALSPKMHSDTLIKLWFRHLIQPLLQPVHSLLEGDPLQPLHLLARIDLHLLKMLIII